MSNHEELSAALLDVRRAYRLLYLFQRRILDLVEELSRKFGQQFYYWLPSGDEEAILGSKNPVERDAWKMLPLFDASFLFLPPGVRGKDSPGKGQWLLELIISPDDGEPEEEVEETDPSTFTDSTACHSMVYLYAFIPQKDIQGDWWTSVYDSSEWPERDGASEENSEGVRVVRLSVDMASLPDSSAANALAERFRELVRTYGGKAA